MSKRPIAVTQEQRVRTVACRWLAFKLSLLSFRQSGRALAHRIGGRYLAWTELEEILDEFWLGEPGSTFDRALLTFLCVPCYHWWPTTTALAGSWNYQEQRAGELRGLEVPR